MQHSPQWFITIVGLKRVARKLAATERMLLAK
jgi:hypothetical protein